jgi:hypothetical protein
MHKKTDTIKAPHAPEKNISIGVDMDGGVFECLREGIMRFCNYIPLAVIMFTG